MRVGSALNREPGITVDFRPTGQRGRSTHPQEPFHRGADRWDLARVRRRSAGWRVCSSSRHSREHQGSRPQPGSVGGWLLSASHCAILPRL